MSCACKRCCTCSNNGTVDSVTEDMTMCRIVANDLSALRNCCNQSCWGGWHNWCQPCCWRPCGCVHACCSDSCDDNCHTDFCDDTQVVSLLQRQNELMLQTLGAMNNITAILLQRER